jgi:uncharacterized protein (DUF488 family)
MHPILTVGHSNHEIDAFLRLLDCHSISAIADVRSTPYSRLHPQFCREQLRDALKSRGIAYVFLGRELGARSEDPRCYLNGVVQYDLLARSELFRSGIERVLRGAEKYRVALLCAERDPLTCHRTILVGKDLTSRGAILKHIRETGQIEEHAAALLRLLKETNVRDADLFRSREELEQEAYARRAKQIAYRRQELPSAHSSEGK